MVEVVEEVVLELVVGSDVVEVVEDVVLELVVGSEVVEVVEGVVLDARIVHSTHNRFTVRKPELDT